MSLLSLVTEVLDSITATINVEVNTDSSHPQAHTLTHTFLALSFLTLCLSKVTMTARDQSRLIGMDV